CDKFYVITPEEKKKIDEQWEAYRPQYQREQGIPSLEQQQKDINAKIKANKRLTRKQQQRLKEASRIDKDTEGPRLQRQTNHLVPRSAGGCPGAPGKNGNLQPNKDLCKVCQGIDQEFSKYQQQPPKKKG